MKIIVGYTVKSRNTRVPICRMDDLFIFNRCDGVGRAIITLLNLVNLIRPVNVVIKPLAMGNYTRSYSRYLDALNTEEIQVAGWLYSVNGRRLIGGQEMFPVLDYQTAFVMREVAADKTPVLQSLLVCVGMATLSLALRLGYSKVMRDRTVLNTLFSFLVHYLLAKYAVGNTKKAFVAHSIRPFVLPVSTVDDLVQQLGDGTVTLVTHGKRSSVIAGLQKLHFARYGTQPDIKVQAISDTRDQFRYISDHPSTVLAVKNFMLPEFGDVMAKNHLGSFLGNIVVSLGILVSPSTAYWDPLGQTISRCRETGIIAQVFERDGFLPPKQAQSSAHRGVYSLLFVWVYILHIFAYFLAMCFVSMIIELVNKSSL